MVAKIDAEKVVDADPNEDLRARLRSLGLVYPGRSFSVLSLEGSDGMIFRDEGEPGVVYKVMQAWRFPDREAEARKLYLMSREGLSPRFYEYVCANPAIGGEWEEEERSRRRGREELEILRSKYGYGSDFVIRHEHESGGLEHPIIKMGLVQFKDRRDREITFEEKVGEMRRLARGMIKLGFFPNDTEIRYDFDEGRFLMFDVYGVRINEYVNIGDIYKVYDCIAVEMASGDGKVEGDLKDEIIRMFEKGELEKDLKFAGRLKENN